MRNIKRIGIGKFISQVICILVYQHTYYTIHLRLMLWYSSKPTNRSWFFIITVQYSSPLHHCLHLAQLQDLFPCVVGMIELMARIIPSTHLRHLSVPSKNQNTSRVNGGKTNYCCCTEHCLFFSVVLSKVSRAWQEFFAPSSPADEGLLDQTFFHHHRHQCGLARCIVRQVVKVQYSIVECF